MLLKAPAVRHRRIHCPTCDERLITVRDDSVIIHGRRPIKMTARPAEEMAIIVCSSCGCLVPVDHDLVRIF